MFPSIPQVAFILTNTAKFLYGQSSGKVDFVLRLGEIFNLHSNITRDETGIERFGARNRGLGSFDHI